MASVIQCLANVPQLRDYFRDGNYVNDINKDNVLGTGGDMANAFHFLLEQMWSGKHTAVKPSRVKVIPYAYRINMLEHEIFNIVII